MKRKFWALVAVCCLSGCSAFRSHAQQALENVGLDRKEQRELVNDTREIALAPGRHGSAGVYVAGAANPQFRGGGGEIGGVYNGYWWEGRIGLAGYGSSATQKAFAGATAAVHLQAPTRLAPFAGVGVFAGCADRDTGEYDENGEPVRTFDGGFASVFPEVGAHFWLTRWLRLTASANYHITTEGRGHDFWAVGGGIAVLFPTDQ